MNNTRLHTIKGALVSAIVILTILVFAPNVQKTLRDDVASYMPSIGNNQALTAKKIFRGQIDYVEGMVETRNGVDDGWRSVKGGEVVEMGTDIRTLGDSRAVVTFEDGSIARLNESSSMTLKDMENTIHIVFGGGEVFHNVTRDENRIYGVEVDGIYIKALGTAFGVEKEKNKDPQLQVLESDVEIQGEAGSVLGVVSQGQKSSLSKGAIDTTELDDADLEKTFITWNMKEDGLYKDVIKKQASKHAEVTTLSLQGKQKDSGVYLTWEVEGSDAPNGYKVIRSTGKDPVYPGDKAVYISDTKARSYMWETTADKMYYFRVCTYDGDGGCLVYSNNAAVKAPSGDKKLESNDHASKISLKAKKKDDEKVKLEWSISGGDAPKGFKIVMSRDKNPKYPGDTYVYLSDPDAREYVWKKDLKEGKSYHFRVCVYKGGECGKYSDDEKVEL